MVERSSYGLVDVLEGAGRLGLEVLDFWIVPGSIVRHVRDGKAIDRSVGTYGLAIGLEIGRIYGYYELARQMFFD